MADDRADEIAREIIDSTAIAILRSDVDPLANAIAAALRSYGDAKLEEAMRKVILLTRREDDEAAVSEAIKGMSKAGAVAYFSTRTANHLLTDVVAAIRSLKSSPSPIEKEPQR